MLSTEHPRIITNILSQYMEQPYYAFKMHANVMSAEKIKQLSEKDGIANLSFYTKTNEKLVINQMKRNDLCLVIQTQPKYYSGCLAIVQIENILKQDNKFIPQVKFIRFLNRKIEISELQNIDQSFSKHQGVVNIGENAFNKVLQLEGQHSTLILLLSQQAQMNDIGKFAK